jgi:hypothetical protein
MRSNGTNATYGSYGSQAMNGLDFGELSRVATFVQSLRDVTRGDGGMLVRI